jgi:hypothetical protein
VTGLSYYVMTWAIKKKGVVFEAAFNPVLVVFSFLLQTFLLGNSTHLGRYVCLSNIESSLSHSKCDVTFKINIKFEIIIIKFWNNDIRRIKVLPNVM